MTLRSRMIWGIIFALSTGSMATVEAGPRRACRLWNCGVGGYTCFDTATCTPCQPVEFQEVQCQVLVPQTVYETRRIAVTEYQMETRQQKVTVYNQVPREEVREVKHIVCDPVVRQREVPVVTCRPVWEEKQVSYTYCEPVYQQHQATRTVMDPVWEDVPREYTVMVPRVEWHTATRMACRMEPVTTTRPICVDRGHWEDQIVGMIPGCITCGPCGPVQTACRPITCRVWRPNLVTEQIPCVTYRPVQYPVEYRYCTTVCEPQTRTCVQKVCKYVPREVPYTYTTCQWVAKTGVQNVRTCRYVQETQSRVEQFTEWVPRTEVRQQRYTVYDCVPSERIVPVQVCRPVQVEREIQVAVCKMIPQTITRRVPVPCPTCIQ